MARKKSQLIAPSEREQVEASAPEAVHAEPDVLAEASLATEVAVEQEEANASAPTVAIVKATRFRLMRCGRVFGKTPVSLALADLKPGELEALQSEPQLIVVLQT